MAKILVIGKYYHPFVGGIETNTLYVAEALANRHEVTVLVNRHDDSEPEEIINNVKVVRKRVLSNIKGQPISAHLFDGISLKEYDLIHFHAPNPFANAALLMKMAMDGSKAKIIITHHMDIYGRKLLRRFSIPLYHRLLKMAGAVIVTSVKNAKISSDLPKGARVVQVPLGIDPERYEIDDALREEGLAWKKQIAGEAPTIGFLGRHARYKGLDVLVEAVSQLPGVHALVAGDGPYRAQAEERARALGVSDRITFLGSVDTRTKLKLLSAIDAFVFPSTEITEAFGISQLEAMICGAPVVATDLPTGVTDVSINGKTALLAKPGDVKDLVAQVELMLTDRGLARKLASQGREHVLANMVEGVVAKNTCKVIEDVLEYN